MSEVANSIKIGMKDLQNLLLSFGPEISVCIRGRHAVGKSEGTYQAAALLRSDFYKDPLKVAQYNWVYDQGLPVIERRLSQLTEGDLTGIPDLGSERKSTVFKPCDWLIDACERPVVLFLDERNRALEGVKQAAFQLMDSKAFYGNKLHPETRVIIAENVGDMYNVQQCDPAEVSRAATVELDPSVEEWLEYASLPGKCHELTVSFIRTNKECLEFDPNNPTSLGTDKAKSQFQHNKKYPDRRSWFKLDQQLQKNGLIENPMSPMFYIMSASMIGIENALKFVSFAKTFDMQVSLQDVLKDWSSARRKLGIHATSTKYMDITRKLDLHLKNHTINNHEAKQIGAFMHDAPADVRMTTWSALQANKNLFRVLPHIESLMIETVDITSKKTTQPQTVAEVEAAAKPSSP